MRAALEAWNCFFFRAATPFDLGVCRILFFGSTLLVLGSRDSALWSEVPEVFWMPVALFRWLHLPVLTGGALCALDWFWRGALALSCVGLFTRASTTASLVAGIYLVGLPHNFGRMSHSDTLVPLGLAIFALSRCGDGLSLDSLRSRQRRAPAAGEYRWPVRAFWVLMVLVYFGAGVSKLRRVGMDWIWTDNMSNILLFHHYSGHMPPTDLGLVLAPIGWAAMAMAGFAVMTEVAAPAALLGSRWRAIVVANLMALQAGIWLLLGVAFPTNLVCLSFWAPWEAGWRRIRGRAVGAGQRLTSERA